MWMVNLQDALQQLYREHELNVSICSFWDCRWRVRIGDELNGLQAERVFSMAELEQIGAWLLEEAARPSSGRRAGHEAERLAQFAASIRVKPQR
jgi:hypothetical protein